MFSTLVTASLLTLGQPAEATLVIPGRAPIDQALFNPDGRRLYFATHAGVEGYDVQTGKALATPPKEEDIVLRADHRYSADHKRFVDQWTVYDVVLDGVSLVSNYRSQFNAIIGTSSVAQLLERMQAEPSRRPQFPDAVAGATITEPETSARDRLAAGLLLGAAAHARWGR